MEYPLLLIQPSDGDQSVSGSGGKENIHVPAINRAATVQRAATEYTD
jgi:hypothetical protein